MKSYNDQYLLRITNLSKNERKSYLEWFGNQEDVVIMRIMSKYIRRYYAIKNKYGSRNLEIISAAALLSIIQIYYVADQADEPNDFSIYWFDKSFLDKTRDGLKKLRGLQ